MLASDFWYRAERLSCRFSRFACTLRSCGVMFARSSLVAAASSCADVCLRISLPRILWWSFRVSRLQPPSPFGRNAPGKGDWWLAFPGASPTVCLPLIFDGSIKPLSNINRGNHFRFRGSSCTLAPSPAPQPTPRLERGTSVNFIGCHNSPAARLPVALGCGVRHRSFASARHIQLTDCQSIFNITRNLFRILVPSATLCFSWNIA